MKKIAFLVLHLGYGGVERAVCNQANILGEKYDVEIISAYKLYDEPAFYLSPAVKVTYLLGDLKPNKEELVEAINKKNPFEIGRQALLSLKILFLRKWAMKKAVRVSDADAIISTRVLYNRILVKNKREGVTSLAQEHVHHGNREKYIKQIVSSLRGMDYFLPVSQELTDFYAEKLKNSHTDCVYIPHNLDFWPDEASDLSEKNLITIGRLAPEKGYLDLLDIYSRLLKLYPDWDLHIVGDGSERPALEEKIALLEIDGKVHLHGYRSTEYIKSLLSKSSVYLMTSFEESFGIVLIEAQAYGLPCIAFEMARGAREIIEDGSNGYLVEGREISAYASKVAMLMGDDVLRRKMGEKGRANAQKFRFENVARQWHGFFDGVFAARQKV